MLSDEILFFETETKLKLTLLFVSYTNDMHAYFIKIKIEIVHAIFTFWQPKSLF